MMEVSIKDIAKAAGVSPSTVSRALSDHPRISLETKERIRGLAEEMEYTPSLLARSLVTQDTATIGVVITSASDPFLARLVTSIEEVAQEQGYSVLMSSSYLDPDRELEVVGAFHGRRTRGIIVIGSQIDTGYVQMRDRFPLPVVLTNCRTYPYSVSTDNLSGARWAVEHLVQLGHRRIAYIANRRSHRSNSYRLQSYQQVLAANGIPVDEDLIIEGDGTLRGGSVAAQILLSRSQPPTAVFCFNDMTAIGVLSGLQQARIRVPEEMSVVGFDDVEFATHCYPRLTTIRQPTNLMGQRLIRMLLALIQGQEDVGPEVLPAELVIRESTGPPPTPA
ncbi:MAG: LacI family DNA-binding transcriptional regulator [Anaerolineae bacterium]